MSTIKPTIEHVRLAEADCLAVQEAYLINRGWRESNVKGQWDCDHLSNASPVSLAQAIELQERRDAKQPKPQPEPQDHGE